VNTVLKWNESDFEVRQKRTFVALFVVTSVSLFCKFVVDKHLSLDGVSYFFHVLENRGFADIAWSRRFTEYLTEWPLVLAVKLGVTNVAVLVKIYAVGIYFPYCLSFCFCWYLVRDTEPSLLWFPLAGYIGFNILSDYDLIADHHVLAVMTWPLLLLLLKDRELRWSEGVMLWILAILYSRMYETAVISALLLAAIAAGRLLFFRNKRERAIVIVCILLLVIAAVVGAQFIFEPRSPQNRGAFLDSIWVNLRNWEAIATISFLGLFGLSWLVSDRLRLLKNISFVCSLVPIVMYCWFRFANPDYAMPAHTSFSSRTLVAVVVPALIIGGVLVTLFKRRMNTVGLSVFSLGFLVMTVFNLYDLRNWNLVREEFLRVIETEKMFVSIDDTLLADQTLDLRHYRWSWNNSLLSLVWSKDCVRTIVLNSPDGPQGPFNPREKLVLKRYLQYHEKFNSVDVESEKCKEN